MENLIGRKVKGFKFEHRWYAPAMDKQIGKIGEIIKIDGDWVLVKIKGNTWFYPLDQIEAHLVHEVPTLEEVKEYFKDAETVKSLGPSKGIKRVYIDKFKKHYEGYVSNIGFEDSILLWNPKNGYAEIITTKQSPSHYDNTNGSIYKFCNDQKLNAWEFDAIKRIVRCRKKGMFREDLEKTKVLIDLYLKEFDNE